MKSRNLVLKRVVIARELGVSVQRVEQIERRALGKLRAAIAEDPDLAESLEAALGEALARAVGPIFPGRQR